SQARDFLAFVSHRFDGHGIKLAEKLRKVSACEFLHSGGFALGERHVFDEIHKRRSTDGIARPRGEPGRDCPFWCSLNPLVVGSRPTELAPTLIPLGAERLDVSKTIHSSHECRVEDFVVGIKMHVKSHTTIEARVFGKWRLSRFYDLELRLERFAHPSRGTKGSALGANDFLAVESDLAIVVSNDDQTPVVVVIEPFSDLVGMQLCIERVVGIEKCDSVNPSGNLD